MATIKKKKIKSDIKKILIEKEVAGEVRSRIINSLVNYAYDTAAGISPKPQEGSDRHAVI